MADLHEKWQHFNRDELESLLFNLHAAAIALDRSIDVNRRALEVAEDKQAIDYYEELLAERNLAYEYGQDTIEQISYVLEIPFRRRELK